MTLFTLIREGKVATKMILVTAKMVPQLAPRVVITDCYYLVQDFVEGL